MTWLYSGATTRLSPHVSVERMQRQVEAIAQLMAQVVIYVVRGRVAPTYGLIAHETACSRVGGGLATRRPTLFAAANHSSGALHGVRPFRTPFIRATCLQQPHCRLRSTALSATLTTETV